MSIAPVSRRTYLTWCAAFAAFGAFGKASQALAPAVAPAAAGGGTATRAVVVYRDMRARSFEFHPVTKAVRVVWANADGDEVVITSPTAAGIDFFFDAHINATYHTIEQTIYPEHVEPDDDHQ